VEAGLVYEYSEGPLHAQLRKTALFVRVLKDDRCSVR